MSTGLKILTAHLEDPELHTLAGYEREHGPSPESAYHRGVALRMGGDRAAARLAFREVGELAARAARFQRKAQSVWVWKAWLGRLA